MHESEAQTPPDRRQAGQAATAARLAAERAEQLARVKARTAGAVTGIPTKTARRFVHATDPRLAAALREKRERQRDEQANRQAAWQLSGPRFTPYSGGRRKRSGVPVTAAVTTSAVSGTARAAIPRAPESFTQVMDKVGADRKWFATGANQ
ncbi:hypothetical protein GCM10009839_14150 [Catenulispora yoronensis]|uniref:Uncharacterized protein n=1 Tax=Catenulispora yoronensis TaxID=450799 RepID=A0ABP5F9J0_9ACTN